MDFGVRERVKRFDSAHGNDGIAYGESHILFSDGAIRDMDPLGLLQEPPKDRYERAKLIVVYREKRLRRASSAFEERKQQIVNTNEVMTRQGYGGVDQSELEKLEELRKAARAEQKRLQQARKELEAATPSDIKLAAAANASNQASGERKRTRLMNIKI